MKLNTSLFGLALFAGLGANAAYACVPDNGPQAGKVRSWFRDSESVFFATIIDVKNLKSRASDKKAHIERVRYRIDRVFKGDRKQGDIYVTETNTDNAVPCGGISAVNSPAWVESANMKGTPEPPLALSRQWLIYSRGRGVGYLQRYGPSRPVDMMDCSPNDLELLAAGRGQKICGE